MDKSYTSNNKSERSSKHNKSYLNESQNSQLFQSQRDFAQMKMQDLKAQAPPTKKKERIYDAPVQLAQDDMAALAEFLKEPTPT